MEQKVTTEQAARRESSESREFILDDGVFTSTFGSREDIPRKEVFLKHISQEDFNNPELISTGIIESVSCFVQESLQNNNYDLFPVAEWVNRNVSSPEQILDINDQQIYGNGRGGICTTMARSLHEFYDQRGVKSYYVSFQTNGQINEAGHNYNPFGHLACIAPFMRNDKKQFLLIDQGLALANPIIFPAYSNSDAFTYNNKRYRVVYDSQNEQAPYTLEISKPVGGGYEKIDEASFDPFVALINPEVFLPEAIRVLPGFRITRYNWLGDSVASASVDYRKNRIKLKYTNIESGESTTTRIGLDNNLEGYSDELSIVAKQLGISSEELISKLRTGISAKDKMLKMVLAPSVANELARAEKTSPIPEKMEYKAITELSEGRLYYHEHVYGLKINISREEGVSEPTPFGESVPTIQIDNKSTFEAATRKLLEFTGNNLHLLWVKSRTNQAPEKTKADMLAQIWFNATEEDFRNPEKFIERQIAFMEDDTFSDLLERQQIIGGDFKGSRLLVDVVQQSGSNETPHMMNFTLEDPDGAKCQIPSVRYAIEQEENGEKTGYIFAIQTPKNTEPTEEDLKLSKKMNRYFYKINDGVLRSESPEYREYRERRSDGEDMSGIPYPDNISDVTVSSVLSLSAALKMMSDRGITNIRVPYFCPLRFQAHARLGQEEQYRIQDNTSNKFMRTFRRVAYHFPAIKVSATNFRGYTDVLIDGGFETNNEILSRI